MATVRMRLAPNSEYHRGERSAWVPAAGQKGSWNQDGAGVLQVTWLEEKVKHAKQAVVGLEWNESWGCSIGDVGWAWEA